MQIYTIWNTSDAIYPHFHWLGRFIKLCVSNIIYRIGYCFSAFDLNFTANKCHPYYKQWRFCRRSISTLHKLFSIWFCFFSLVSSFWFVFLLLLLPCMYLKFCVVVFIRAPIFLIIWESQVFIVLFFLALSLSPSATLPLCLSLSIFIIIFFLLQIANNSR